MRYFKHYFFLIFSIILPIQLYFSAKHPNTNDIENTINNIIVDIINDFIIFLLLSTHSLTDFYNFVNKEHIPTSSAAPTSHYPIYHDANDLPASLLFDI